jgi:hypothetical protein
MEIQIFIFLIIYCKSTFATEIKNECVKSVSCNAIAVDLINVLGLNKYGFNAKEFESNVEQHYKGVEKYQAVSCEGIHLFNMYFWVN